MSSRLVFKVVPSVNEVLPHLQIAGNDEQQQEVNQSGWLKRAEDLESPFPLSIGGQDIKDGLQRYCNEGVAVQCKVVTWGILISENFHNTFMIAAVLIINIFQFYTCMSGSSTMIVAI